MLPWFTKYPNQNDEILNLDWVIRQVENLKAAYEAFLAANSLTFADPIVWDITKQYSKNTIVLSPEGDAYLSKKVVGAGIQLNNTEYWLEIFNFAEYVRIANSNLTEHIELNTTRATAAYAIDDWLLWEDVLYKVTAAIAVDDLLTVGTNIVHFTVEDFCRAWQTYMVNTIAQYKLDIDASELQFNNTMTGLVNQYKNDIDASELAYRNQLALDIANTTDSLQSQLNTAIAGATVDSEVIVARVDIFNLTHATLRDAIVYQIGTTLNLVEKRYQYSVNMFDKSTVFTNIDIISGTGAFQTNSGTDVSDKIHADFTKRLYILGSTFSTYAYCYDVDNNYLGRVDVNNVSTPIATTYPATSYVRIEIDHDDIDAIMLIYADNYKAILSNTYIPYKEFEQITDEKALHKNNSIGNLFDPTDIIEGYYLNYQNNAIAAEGEYFSEPIYIDGSKYLVIRGSTSSSSGYQYAYCYSHSGAFLGRYDAISGIIPNTAANGTVEYIRVNGKNGDNICVINGYVPTSKYFNSINPCLLKGNVARRKFRILSFNAGDFTGTGLDTSDDNSWKNAYLEIIQAAQSDLAFFQYDVAAVNSHQVYPYIVGKFHVVSQYHGGSAYNYSSMASNFDVMKESTIDYTYSDVAPTHTYFGVTDVIIDGTLVHICNIHLDWKDNNLRQEEITQIITDCNSYENCIVIGDFNPDDYINGVKQSDNLTYEADLALFEAAGFTPINANNEYFGVVNTIADNSTHGPYDNILIKGNILCCSFERMERDWMNDHYPVVADLIITE